jgi:hypothetical protein
MQWLENKFLVTVPFSSFDAPDLAMRGAHARPAPAQAKATVLIILDSFMNAS